MKNRQQVASLAALVIVSILATGCGTISFFPTAPAQKAADKVIEDSWPSLQRSPLTVPVVAVGVPKEKESPPGPVISPKPEAK